MAGRKLYTKKILVDNLKKVASELGRPPKRREYSRHISGIASSDTLSRYFGSYAKALRKAGMKPVYGSFGYRKFSKNEIIDNLIIVTADLGHIPKYREYEQHEKHIASVSTIRSYFGTYKRALNAMAKEMEDNNPCST